jgi:hypothetical protein
MQNRLFDVIIITGICDESVTIGDENKIFFMTGYILRRIYDGKAANR